MFSDGYQTSFENILFMTAVFGLPPIIFIAALIFKKPGSPDQFGPPPQPKSIASATLTVLNKSLNFQTRATRSEFWWYFVVSFILINTLAGILMTRWMNEIGWVVEALLCVPGLALGTRRLHDIGRSGWWQVFMLTGSGFLILCILWLLPPSPTHQSTAEVFE